MFEFQQHGPLSAYDAARAGIPVEKLEATMTLLGGWSRTSSRHSPYAWLAAKPAS